MSNTKRQSFVEKKVEFVINVGNFESLRVGTTFGETIEWASPEERQKKLDALTKNLANEVAKDAKEVLTSYGLKRKVTAQYKKESGEVNDLDYKTEESGELVIDDVSVEEDDEDFEL